MKKIFISMLIAVMLVATSAPAFADDQGLQMTWDIILVRPVSLAATVAGTALFIVALPFTIPSGSVKATGRALVAEPFKYTFTRPIGEFRAGMATGNLSYESTNKTTNKTSSETTNESMSEEQ